MISGTFYIQDGNTVQKFHQREKYTSKCDQTLWTCKITCAITVADQSWLVCIWLDLKISPQMGRTAGPGKVCLIGASGQLINGCFSRGWSIGLFRMCNFSYLAVIGGKSNQEKANNLARVRRTLKIIFWAVQLILVVKVETENSF